jgi:hypothetical protein
MRLSFAGAVAGVALAALAWMGAEPAWAACTRLAFSVNDYGKDGPTKDANKLLDKYIADWTKSKGITGHTVSKRDVNCELFLDFGVFDEHTCKASALVCWQGGSGSNPKSAAPGK